MAQMRRLAGDLVNSIVMVETALFRGYGFARHVRTNVEQEGGLWREDAVYTNSPALPRGVRKTDADGVVANCADKGLPTV